jgi:hypothetical protein
MVRSKSCLRVFVRFESEPGALGRVLEPFAVQSLSPHELTLRANARGMAFVVAEFEGLDRERGTLLVARLRQIPCVASARLSKIIR